MERTIEEMKISLKSKEKQLDPAEIYVLPKLKEHLRKLEEQYPFLSPISFSYTQLQYHLSFLLLHTSLGEVPFLYENGVISTFPMEENLTAFASKLKEDPFLASFFGKIDYIPYGRKGKVLIPHFINDQYQVIVYKNLLWIQALDTKEVYYYPVEADHIYSEGKRWEQLELLKMISFDTTGSKFDFSIPINTSKPKIFSFLKR